MADHSDSDISKAIRSHPLFRIVTLLVQKCEDALWNGDYNTDISNVIELLKEFKTKHSDFKCEDPQVDSLLIEAILEFQRHLRQIHRLYALTEVYVVQKKDQLKEKTVKSADPSPFRVKSLQDIIETQRPRKKFTINEILGNQNYSE
ncbi:unnamed protein product [Bursaphelenchus xylophilus]|uniref:(pine wood nematode) hypothetical protein n=1 Tax=Bursaphelenchus xylophilus TaxID=6326 RepID=A0A1I7STU7_BURXY|nr:unnamed protein product [Bursaphelenchus xylophilus]CAG9107944.1 unnamed protein product [Bursaphelenchus xylophilus]